MKYTIIDVEKDAPLASFEDSKPQALEGVTAARRGTQFEVRRGGERVTALLSTAADGTLFLATEFGNLKLKVQRGELAVAGGAGTGGLRVMKSSMPGKVVRLLCKAGDRVERDQPLLILEAMKMENEIRAVAGGVVAEVKPKEGDKVETGGILVKIDEKA